MASRLEAFCYSDGWSVHMIMIVSSLFPSTEDYSELSNKVNNPKLALSFSHSSDVMTYCIFIFPINVAAGNWRCVGKKKEKDTEE